MKAVKIALLALLVVGPAGASGSSGSSPGFKASREFDTSAKGTNSVALGDLNGDGKLDVVAAHGAFDDDPPAISDCASSRCSTGAETAARTVLKNSRSASRATLEALLDRDG